MDSPFEQLRDSDKFEELVFDLLRAEGFGDLIWRGPAADGGRDIEATWDTRDPVGSILRTKWYVECKWYTGSLSFGDIEPKLLAASAARVDFLLVVVSSRVKNTALDDVQRWLAVRGNPFRVRCLVGRDVIHLLVKHADVFRKHFPGVAQPSWGAGEAEAARLRALAATSADRLSWRLVPMVQWLQGLVSGGTAGTVLAEELDLLGCMLRAHQLFGPESPTPSRRTLSLREALGLAVACAKRREPGGAVTEALSDCDIYASRPLFVAAAFEIVFNAVKYAADRSVTIGVVLGDHQVAVEIRNTSATAIPPDWPQWGLRAIGGTNRSGASQGLGCSIADRAATAAGWRVRWAKENGLWLTTLEGERR